MNIQFNKVAQLEFRRQLMIRQSALPTLKSKEAALRLWVKMQKERVDSLEALLAQRLEVWESQKRLWGEFPEDLFTIGQVILGTRRVAGVEVPEFKDVQFTVKPFPLFLSPTWLAAGVESLKEITRNIALIETERQALDLLDYARRKTTQKVNLYEKVQIPQFSEAVTRIKRYLEDVENLEKAGQKITKTRQTREGGAS